MGYEQNIDLEFKKTKDLRQKKDGGWQTMHFDLLKE